DFPPDPEGITAYLRTPSTDVPDVVGLNQADATEAIRTAHLNASVVEVPSSEPVGTVVAQSPEAGAVISEGSSVAISVSVEGEPIPQFEGRKRNDFEKAFNDFQAQAGLSLIVDYQTVETTDPKKVGILLRQRPAAGSIVGNGDTIIVIFGVQKK
ncbi:MAG: PASTA domain-containing protein, partial [Acidimicrobiia bacterium]|nr:PASTA domain-containing protein [Acidimicrobiia bacterium]